MQQSQVCLHWVVSLLLSKELVGRSWPGRDVMASAHQELGPHIETDRIVVPGER